MNIDAKRHKLLEILAKQRMGFELGTSKGKILGVPFEKINKELKCSDDELDLIVSDLFDSEEIQYYNEREVEGLCATGKGTTAFSNKKYYNRVIQRQKERIKFFVQTAIPILALIVAVLSLSIKFDSLKTQSDKELQKLKHKLLLQQKQIDSMVTDLKSNPIPKNDKDSLSVEKN